MTNLAADLALVAESYTKDVALPDGVTWPDDVIREAIRQVEYADQSIALLREVLESPEARNDMGEKLCRWEVSDDLFGRIEDHLKSDSVPSQGGECAGLAPPAGCRWPKTCGAQLAEAAVREEGEGPLREIAHRHAREAVAPIGSLAAEKRHDPVVAQNILRQEEIIFYALKEAQRTSLLEGA